MRPLMLALCCGLLLASGPALAGKRGDSSAPAPRHQAAVAKAKPARAQDRHSRPVARTGKGTQAKLSHAAQVRGRLGASRDDRAAFASSACARVRGVGRCRPQPVMSWTHGLPPAAGVQAESCPAGTMATLARGHDDIVRCMPI